jgi:ribonuclease HI
MRQSSKSVPIGTDGISVQTLLWLCREYQGVGVVLVLYRGAIFEQSVCLEYYCINNQAEYEAILLVLQILSSMSVKDVEAFVDLLLVM